MSVEALLAQAAEQRPEQTPTGITLRAEDDAPASVTLGSATVYQDVYTGRLLGEPTQRVRGAMSELRAWHRYMALDGDNRPLGKAISGWSNLLFLFIVLSGMYLWIPRVVTWASVRAVALFRGGLPGKARDFNWHNVIGIWSAVPLAIVVATAAPISFPWANALVYRIVGEEPPAPAGGGRPGPNAGERAGNGGPRGRSERQQPQVRTDGLDTLWVRAEQQVPGWRSINLRLPSSPAGPAVFAIDSGNGGQPQLRSTLTLDRRPPRSSAGSHSRARQRAAVCAAGADSLTPASTTVSSGRRSPVWCRAAPSFWSIRALRSRSGVSSRGFEEAALPIATRRANPKRRSAGTYDDCRPGAGRFMLVHIPGVLTNEQVADVRQRLDAADWVEGRVTAGHQSARVKRNAQLPEGSPAAEEIGDIVLTALQRNPLFLAAALPLRVFPPLFNRYEGGQAFGSHVDNAIRQIAGTGHRIRTDLSATLFLAGPEEYDGGELLVEDTYGVHSVKLPAGHLVLYPSTSLHRVQPVTRGARIASFFWIQSMIRDDGERTLLFDLDMAIQRLNQDTPDHPAALPLTGVYHNLLRKWAEM